MAESGPSVVVWELSLMGDEACVPSLRSIVGSDGTVLIWLELGLRMSSSSPLVAVLRSIESGCSVCCARGCSVMMSCIAESVAELVEPGVERPVGAASSPLISPLTEAEDRCHPLKTRKPPSELKDLWPSWFTLTLHSWLPPRVQWKEK